MKEITGYLKDYIHHLDWIHVSIVILMLSILIWVNYTFQLNELIWSAASFYGKCFRYYLLFASVFSFTYFSGFLLSRKPFPVYPSFYLLLLSAPMVFAVKVAFNSNSLISVNDHYLHILLQWPFKALITFIQVWLLWRMDKNPYPLSGLTTQNFHFRPYLLLLMAMIPVIWIAGLGSEFQQVYPKLKALGSSSSWAIKLLFELSYGLDFFTIELFFRGFLILAFIKYAGKDAILPMAVFYCTIHFGKPVAECISSFFGGILLGVIVYYTRSIWGGLILHLGIAWMMELVGILKITTNS